MIETSRREKLFDQFFRFSFHFSWEKLLFVFIPSASRSPSPYHSKTSLRLLPVQSQPHPMLESDNFLKVDALLGHVAVMTAEQSRYVVKQPFRLQARPSPPASPKHSKHPLRKRKSFLPRTLRSLSWRRSLRALKIQLFQSIKGILAYYTFFASQKKHFLAGIIEIEVLL